MKRRQAFVFELMPKGEQQRDIRRFAGCCRFVFRYPDSKQFEIDEPDSRLKLPKLGWIRYRNSREILGTAKDITIRLSFCEAGTHRGDVQEVAHA